MACRCIFFLLASVVIKSASRLDWDSSVVTDEGAEKGRGWWLAVLLQVVCPLELGDKYSILFFDPLTLTDCHIVWIAQIKRDVLFLNNLVFRCNLISALIRWEITATLRIRPIFLMIMQRLWLRLAYSAILFIVPTLFLILERWFHFREQVLLP